MNERTLTLWWSGWPVVAARAAAGPAAVDRRQAAMVVRANRVIACSPAAAAAGVAPGQRRRIAQQRCPEAVLLDDDPDRDARLFEPVVHAIERFTPRLEVVEPGWLAIVTRGPSRYFGGDRRLAERIVAEVAELVGEIDGYGVGVADGRFASATAARRAADIVLLARRGRGGASSRQQNDRIEIVEPGGTAAFLAPLTVDWLADTGGVDPDLVGLFARLGLLTLGDLADVTATDVSARFGPDGGRAHALASGLDGDVLQTRVPTPLRAVERAFDEPVLQLEPLVFVGKQLADELASDLEAAGLSCVRLTVTAETEHGERSERAWYRAGGLSVLAMVERVRWQLDGWVHGATMSTAAPSHSAITAGVVLLRLDPVELRPAGGDQQALWGGTSAADERAARAIAHLAGIVGEEAVKVPAWQGGRLPGDRYRWIPATTVDVTDPDDTAERLRPQISRLHAWPGAIPEPSPAMVLDRSTGERPPAAELADADGRPVTVSGRGMISAAPATITIDSGTIGSQPPQTIVAWAGPWPLDERWWDPRRHRRLARLQVVTDDGTARLVAARRGHWWILATYL